jgi:hypothetical protein
MRYRISNNIFEFKCRLKTRLKTARRVEFTTIEGKEVATNVEMTTDIKHPHIREETSTTIDHTGIEMTIITKTIIVDIREITMTISRRSSTIPRR